MSKGLVRQELVEGYRDCEVTVTKGLLDGQQVAIVEERYESLGEASAAIRQSLLAIKLNHPNVCTAYDCFLEKEGARFKSVLCIERLDFVLSEQVKLRAAQQAYWSESELMRYLMQLTAALSFAQQQAITHRDVKPHNVYCSSDGRSVKIGGFYAVKKLTSDWAVSQTIVGTPLFFSPQKKRMFVHHLYGKEDTSGYNSFKSDVYSLGVMFLYLARLSSPSDLAYLDKLYTVTRKLLSEVSAYSTLRYFLEKMLQVEEEDRCDFVSLEQELQRWRSQIEQSDYKDQWDHCAPSLQPVRDNCVYCFAQVDSCKQVTAECGHVFHDAECFFACVRDASETAESVHCPRCGLPISPAFVERVLTTHRGSRR